MTNEISGRKYGLTSKEDGVGLPTSGSDNIITSYPTSTGDDSTPPAAAVSWEENGFEFRACELEEGADPRSATATGRLQMINEYREKRNLPPLSKD